MKGRLERKDSASNIPPTSSSSISIFFRGSKVDKDSSADEGNDNNIDDVEVSSPSSSQTRGSNVSGKHGYAPTSIYRKMSRLLWSHINLRGVVILFLLLYTVNLLIYWLPEYDLDEV